MNGWAMELQCIQCSHLCWDRHDVFVPIVDVQALFTLKYKITASKNTVISSLHHGAGLGYWQWIWSMACNISSHNGPATDALRISSSCLTLVAPIIVLETSGCPDTNRKANSVVDIPYNLARLSYSRTADIRFGLHNRKHEFHHHGQEVGGPCMPNQIPPFGSTHRQKILPISTTFHKAVQHELVK